MANCVLRCFRFLHLAGMPAVQRSSGWSLLLTLYTQDTAALIVTGTAAFWVAEAQSKFEIRTTSCVTVVEKQGLQDIWELVPSRCLDNQTHPDLSTHIQTYPVVKDNFHGKVCWISIWISKHIQQYTHVHIQQYIHLHIQQYIQVHIQLYPTGHPLFIQCIVQRDIQWHILFIRFK